MRVASILSRLADLLWCAPVVFLLLFAYFYISRRHGFPQRQIIRGLRTAFSGDHAVRKSLSVHLAAVLGVGNIMGVAMAITLGGPGAVFWCWMAGFAGMGVQYAECLCALRYRGRPAGELSGGPMVAMRLLGMKGSACLYAAATVLCGLCMGAMIPANAIGNVLVQGQDARMITALLLAVLTAVVILGGAHRIVGFCTSAVPLLVVLYLLSCAVILWICRGELLPALTSILQQAFTPSAALSGTAGYGIASAMRWGVARGLFSSEAGLGTAGIGAAVSAEGKPEDRALGCACQSVWDTLILAAITGVTFMAAALHCGYGCSDPLLLAQGAFAMIPGVGKWLLPFFLTVLGFSTIIGWYAIARDGCLFLFPHGRGWFAWIWIAAVFAGTMLLTDLAWTLSDIFSMLMLLPNLRLLFAVLPRTET